MSSYDVSLKASLLMIYIALYILPEIIDAVVHRSTMSLNAILYDNDFSKCRKKTQKNFVWKYKRNELCLSSKSF